MTPNATDLLPNWYLKFLDTYNTLKNDICTYYLGIGLNKIHDRLTTCTLFRSDDRNKGRYLSMDNQTENARQFLRSYFPDFPFTDQCVAIAWNGYCNLEEQWDPYCVILVVKNGNKRAVYAIDTDNSGLQPLLVSKNFDTFFVNLNEIIQKAETYIRERKISYMRKNEELIPLKSAFSYVDVQIKAGKELDDILQQQFYLHFDAEGFIGAADYEDVLRQLLDMTGLDYQIVQADNGRNLNLLVKSTQYQLPVDTASDYFDESLVERMNKILEDYKSKKKFQIIFPYTTGNADQSIAVGYCSPREIEVLRKNRYVE